MLKLVKHVIILFLKLGLETILDKMILLDRNTTWGYNYIIKCFNQMFLKN
jgi:hypothetical protein